MEQCWSRCVTGIGERRPGTTVRRPAAVHGVWRAGHPRTPPALRTRALRDVDGTFPPWLMWALVIGLLFNWALSSTMLGTPPQADGPQLLLRAGVRQATSPEVTAVEDEICLLRSSVSYPPDDESSTAITEFRTQRPAFAQDEPGAGPHRPGGGGERRTGGDGVAVAAGAARLRARAAFSSACSSGSCGAAAGMSGGGSGTSAGPGQPQRPDSGRAPPSPTAGIDEVKAERMEVVDFLKNPQRHRKPRVHSRRRLLTGPTVEDTSREPSRVRRTCPSSTCPPRSSSR